MKAFPIGLSTDTLRQAAEREGWKIETELENVVFARREDGRSVLVVRGKVGPEGVSES